MTTPKPDHAGRLARCRTLLAERGLDAVLVSDRYDVLYLSGFRGEDATLVVGPETALLVTDSRFYAQVHEEVDEFELVEHLGTDLFEDSVKAAAGRIGDGFTLGYQAGAMTHAEYRGLRRAHHGRLRDVRRHVTRLRMVKEPVEAEAIAAAAALVDLALGVVVAEGLVGRTETEVAWRLLEEYHARGAEGESFEAIVAAGDHGAQGHAIPGERRIKAGELVVIDTGARFDGYCSDITRTFAAGRVSKAHRKLYEIVYEAQAAGVAAVRHGAHGRDDVDAGARAVIKAAGYGEQFGHGTGHGVGLEVHEAPFLGSLRGDRLEAGMVCTVEPGVYLEGEVGVRIEDTVLVTADGCERLTQYPRELQVTD
ncbi:MAG: Xaa-Pro peptidase family protein [Thermoleophilia bacterium]|jgi:Xaa-Pro aminopeptidase|nr:Xaa-Pro peptidase family protein [Thermoleophilia bacterium]